MTNEKPKRTAQVADKFIVRLPPGMRDEIFAAAKANNRSMNAELVARLAKSFNPIEDEEDVMRAVHAIIRHSAKFNVDVSVNFSGSPESLLAKAIQNGSLPADATLEDLADPSAALARISRAAVKSKR
ncbi:Arc family DNA-binding protein [Massilia sp. RP-1-19]|uniref:Arc family DNA-binding protein n=1 Tax=Massilia polaris TaxID=2728846 RepID=A0A848HR73_9BURK|nr:Arc family DNA-binding protein [Massilia polaris]NML61793.1 Arc family DNA-binding protein [Massilia polaris]